MKSKAEELLETTEDIDNCVYCGESTRFGSGRFVNRIPVDDGYACADCSGMTCDYCEEQIPADEDVLGPEGVGFYHEGCLYKHK